VVQAGGLRFGDGIEVFVEVVPQFVRYSFDGALDARLAEGDALDWTRCEVVPSAVVSSSGFIQCDGCEAVAYAGRFAAEREVGRLHDLDHGKGSIAEGQIRMDCDEERVGGDDFGGAQVAVPTQRGDVLPIEEDQRGREHGGDEQRR